MERESIPAEGTVEAEHLIDWKMQDGEEVVFSYRNFVAKNFLMPV